MAGSPPVAIAHVGLVSMEPGQKNPFAEVTHVHSQDTPVLVIHQEGGGGDEHSHQQKRHMPVFPGKQTRQAVHLTGSSPEAHSTSIVEAPGLRSLSTSCRKGETGRSAVPRVIAPSREWTTELTATCEEVARAT